MDNQEQEQNDLGFSLNGNDYKFDDLNDEQKYVVQQLKDIQVQIERIEFQHTQVSGAKQHFTDQLVKSIESPDSKKDATEATSVENSA